MAEILIKGIDLPKDSKISISITSNGSAYLGIEPAYSEKKFETIVLQHHGRLGDLDKLFNDLKRMCVLDSLAYTTAHEILQGLVKNAETVIEASI